MLQTQFKINILMLIFIIVCLVDQEKKSKITKVISLTTGFFFYFHINCLVKWHSHIIENTKYITGELRLIRHYHLFSKNDFQIPIMNEHNQHFDDQIFNMRIRFYSSSSI